MKHEISQNIGTNVLTKKTKLQNTIMSGNRGSRRGRYRNDNKQHYKPVVGEKGREVLKDIDETNPVIQAFRIYASELDEKHDRYERIVKLSRDITIESKRIIFLLHNCDKENKRDSILTEAENRLQNLIQTQFKCIAKELENQDHFQYLRAYTAGLQEFIEAFTFYQYLKNNSIENWSNLEQQFNYQISESNSGENNDTQQQEQQLICVKDVKTPLPAVEFILGIADLTGELMRKCINNLGSGNIEDCFQTCNFVKELNKGFLSIVGTVGGYREINRKHYTLKQSLNKMEMVCYNIVVRGSEVPKHMLAAVVSTNNADMVLDEDEGISYY